MVVCCLRVVVTGLFVVVVGIVVVGTHHGEVVVCLLGFGGIVVGGRGPAHQVVFFVVVL